MYQRDYLMRQIWALTEWIARNAAKHPDRETLQKEALRADFGDWYKRFRLPPLNIWLRMNEEDGLRLLNWGDHPQYERYFSAALLLKAEAAIAIEDGANDIAHAILKRSLYAALRCWRTGESGFLETFRVSEVVNDIWQIYESLFKGGSYELPACTLFELVLFWETFGRFDESENAIFAYSEMQIQDNDSNARLVRFVNEWFLRMSQRSEEELMQGGWGFAEVRASKRDWELLFKIELSGL